MATSSAVSVDVPTPCVIACAADDRYSMPVAVMLFSALTNYSGDNPFEIYLFDAGISSANKHRIQRVLSKFMVRLHWLEPCAEALQNLPIRAYFSITCYFRLLIPELLPERQSKAIYLDCDLIVEADLADLWGLRIEEDHFFLAAQDLHVKTIGRSPLSACSELSFPPQADYFNSGVLVMNLDCMRKEVVASKVIDFSLRCPEAIRFADQDGLNAVAVGRWEKLDVRWNWLVKPSKSERFGYKSKAILHFVGSAKPWLIRTSLNRRKDGVGCAYRLFDEYARISGWFTPTEWLLYRARRAYYYHASRPRLVLQNFLRRARRVLQKLLSEA